MALLFVGILLGFALGTRAKFLSAIRQMGKALVSFAVKVKVESHGGVGPGGGGDGEDEKVLGTDEDELPEDIVERFLSNCDDVGLDDHPDIVMSLIVQYQIKKTKDEQRVKARMAQLAAEGLDETEIADRMAAGGGAAGGDSRNANPLAILIAVGAQVEPTKGSGSSDAIQRIEQRRLQRTVDVYLSKTLDVSVKRTEPRTRDERGMRMTTAVEKAKQTEKPTEEEVRFDRQAKVAKESRALYRHWKKTNPPLYIYKEDEDIDDGFGAKREDRAGLEAVSMEDLALLQAEFADDEELASKFVGDGYDYRDDDEVVDA